MTRISGEINHGFSNSEAAHVPVDAIQVASPHMQGPAEPQLPSRPRKPRTVVHVENANKIYGPGCKANHVLRDLCMAVEEHTIYGLLGASGCGKTTILTCIVALRTLNSGSILVCGEPTGTPKSGIPGKKVGYMPQEIALNGEFTIVEVLAYFGRIYGMTRSDIKNRTKYLVTLLSLRGLNQSIQNLSDGQKRRVSMAVSLLHEPDLLVLDEPTVGCDPLLRESIWCYLHDLVARNAATVIVTTHYIEEMRQADRIGIMRSGHLLCEDSPSNLLQIYNENLLDSVVVKLCKQDERPKSSTCVLGPFDRGNHVGEIIHPGGNHAHVDVIRLDTLPNGRGKTMPTAPSIQAEWSATREAASTTSIWHHMHGLLVKDLLVVVRNWWFSLVLALLPALTVTLFCVALDSRPADLKFGVVNYETDVCPAQSGLVSKGNESMMLNSGSGGGCLTSPPDLSCAFIDGLNKKAIKLIPFETEDDAEAQALKGKIWGYFWMGENFSTHFYKRVVLNDLSDNATLSESQINVRLDTTVAETAQFLEGAFTMAFEKTSASLFQLCGVDASARELPIHFGEPIFSFGKKDVVPIGYMATGISLGFLFFMCALQCGLTYIIEKKDGMLNRTMVSGVAKIEIMLSHFIIQLFAVAMSQILVCFFLIFVIFDTVSEGSILLGFALVLLNCIVGMSLGFMLATFCADEKYAMLMAMGFVFPNFLLAGLLWPLERLPPVLQYVGQALPCTITAAGFRSIITRGMDMSNEIVWLGFVTSAGWLVLYWTIIVLSHKFGQRKQ